MNKKMNFTQFIEAVKDQIRNYLPEDFKDAETIVTHIEKSDGEYEGLRIIRPFEKIQPVINLNDAFKKYEQGVSMEEICKKLADIRVNKPIPEGLTSFNFTDFGNVKDKLYPNLISADNKEYLKDKPFRMVEDLYVSYAIRLVVNGGTLGQVTVDKTLLDLWKVDEETLYKVAFENMEKEEPAFSLLLESLFGGMDQEFDPEGIDLQKINEQVFILSNKQKTRGAVMMLSKKYMDRIVNCIGSVYVFAVSVREAIVIPKSFLRDPAPIYDMIEGLCGDTEFLPQEEKLSDSLYEYDATDRKLVLLGKKAA